MIRILIYTMMSIIPFITTRFIQRPLTRARIVVMIGFIVSMFIYVLVGAWTQVQPIIDFKFFVLVLIISSFMFMKNGRVS